MRRIRYLVYFLALKTEEIGEHIEKYSREGFFDIFPPLFSISTHFFVCIPYNSDNSCPAYLYLLLKYNEISSDFIYSTFQDICKGGRRFFFFFGIIRFFPLSFII